MSAWQPDAASLAALTGLLADVQRPDVNQQSMLAQLNAYKGNPGFNNYLAHIFCSDAIQDEAVRLTTCTRASAASDNSLACMPARPTLSAALA